MLSDGNQDFPSGVGILRVVDTGDLRPRQHMRDVVDVLSTRAENGARLAARGVSRGPAYDGTGTLTELSTPRSVTSWLRPSVWNHAADKTMCFVYIHIDSGHPGWPVWIGRSLAVTHCTDGRAIDPDRTDRAAASL